MKKPGTLRVRVSALEHANSSIKNVSKSQANSSTANSSGRFFHFLLICLLALLSEFFDGEALARPMRLLVWRSWRGLLADDPAHDIDRAAHQRHGGFERAKGCMRGKRHILKACERMIGFEWLRMKNIKPGVPDV